MMHEIDNLLDEILDQGYSITLYSNALGSITGKLHSIEEDVIDDNDSADNWKNGNQKSIILEGENIVDGFSLADVITKLYQKSECYKKKQKGEQEIT